MIPSMRVARASSAPSGAWPAGVCESRPYRPGHRLAVADRQVERGDAGAEALLAGRDRGLLVGARVVAPGDDDRPRHPDRGALLPLRDRGRVDQAFAALVRGDDEQRGVRGAQPGPQLADEVAVAGGVDQVDLVLLVEDGGDGQRDRPLLAHRGGIVVAHRGAVDDGARAGDRGRVGEKGLDEGGLAAPRGPDENDVADFRRIGDAGDLRASERLAALTVMGRPPPRHCVEASGSSHTRSRVWSQPPVDGMAGTPSAPTAAAVGFLPCLFPDLDTPSPPASRCPPPPARRGISPWPSAASAASSPRSTSSSRRAASIVVDISCNARDEAHAEEITAALERAAGRAGAQGLRPDVPAAPRRQDRGALQGQPAQPRRPLPRLHPRRRPGLPGDRGQPGRRPPADDQAQHRRGRHRRLRRARPGQPRPGRRDAGDGGQGGAVQAVRRASTPGRSAWTPRTPRRSSGPSRSSPRPTAASTWRTSPRRAASRSRPGCARCSTSRSSTTTSTAPRSSCSPRCATRCGWSASGSPTAGSWSPGSARPAPRSSGCCCLRTGRATSSPSTSTGSCTRGRPGMDPNLVCDRRRRPTPTGAPGTLADALVGADVFIGVSAPNLFGAAELATMASDAIVFALANPDPEVDPRRRSSTPRSSPPAGPTTRTRSTTCSRSPACSAGCSTRRPATSPTRCCSPPRPRSPTWSPEPNPSLHRAQRVRRRGRAGGGGGGAQA